MKEAEACSRRFGRGYDRDMAVFQCPACELRFSLAAELEEHLNSAHPDFEARFEKPEDELLAAKRRRERQNKG